MILVLIAYTQLLTIQKEKTYQTLSLLTTTIITIDIFPTKAWVLFELEII